MPVLAHLTICLALNVRRGDEDSELPIAQPRLAYPKAVQTQQHSQRSMVAIKPLRGKEVSAQLAPIEAAPFRGLNLGTAYVLGGVGADPAVDVSEAVETARGGQTPIDGRRRQPSFLHRGSVHLQMSAGRFEHR